jgi:hypothetical protein
MELHIFPVSRNWKITASKAGIRIALFSSNLSPCVMMNIYGRSGNPQFLLPVVNKGLQGIFIIFLTEV